MPQTMTRPFRDRVDAGQAPATHLRNRAMFRGRASSWNLRDTHMADTLDALIRHLDVPGRPAKLVVWAHNSHLGDARATEMGQHGEINLGQLVRERHPGQSVPVGFTTLLPRTGRRPVRRPDSHRSDRCARTARAVGALGEQRGAA
jgi:hypothetical protein